MLLNAREMQHALKQAGYDIVVDGRVGLQTQSVLRAFQSKVGLTVDGVYGYHTDKALQDLLNPAKVDALPEPNKSAMLSPQVPLPNVGPVDDALGFTPLLPSIPWTSRTINTIAIHCTATPEGKNYSVADITAWHKQRGFETIGYHYVVNLRALILEGRALGQIGAHIANHNYGSIGISYVGGLTSDSGRAKDTRTASQKKALLVLVTYLTQMFNIREIVGHNQLAAKACPCFDVRKDELGNIPGFSKGIRI